MTIKIGLVVLSLFLIHVVAFADTIIDRDIVDPLDPRAQWSPQGSPYIIAPAGDFIYIGNNVTLTIQAGVTVKFNSGKSLVITDTATLRADGTSNPITFTSNTASPPLAGFWQGLRVDGGSASILINCKIEYAAYGLSIPNASTAVKVYRPRST